MTALDEIKIGGLGSSRKRVEDNRFIRGKGNYVDDIVLPGMLHMEILRSPLAHARITSIDTSKAWDIPGVRLVMTGEMMAARNLAWMPTLSYDTQAVLATDKVRFQGQEVACVIADDPYIAKDACEAIVVEYEPLPVIVNPTQALAAGAPLIRDDKENQHDNVVFDWEVGDKDGTDQRVRCSRPRVEARAALPAVASLASRVLRIDRGLQPVDVEAHRVHDHAGAAHHQSCGRVGRRAARAHDPHRVARPRRRVRQQGAGLPGLRHVDPRVDPARAAGEVDRGSQRQPHLDGLRARHLLRGELALRKDGKILGVRMHTDSDHGAFFSDAQPSKFKIGLMHSAFACYDIPFAHLTARRVHEQGAGRRRVSVLVPGDRSHVLPRAHGQSGCRRPRDGPGRLPSHELRA